MRSHTDSLQKWRNNNEITNDVKNGDGRSHRCTEAQATCAFLFFGFFAFLASTIFSGLNARGGSVGGGEISKSYDCISSRGKLELVIGFGLGGSAYFHHFENGVAVEGTPWHYRNISDSWFVSDSPAHQSTSPLSGALSRIHARSLQNTFALVGYHADIDNVRGPF